ISREMILGSDCVVSPTSVITFEEDSRVSPECELSGECSSSPSGHEQCFELPDVVDRYMSFFHFFQNSTPSPPRPVQGSPPPPQSNSGTGHGKSINVVAIVVPTIVAVILAAICTYFITRRIRKNRKKRKP
ncbi:hypothetical protein IFM89_000290, partial [Coptis chinensis]